MDMKDFFQESTHPDYLDIKRQLTKQLQEKELELARKTEHLEHLLRSNTLNEQEIAVAKRELETERGAFRQEMDRAFAKLEAIQQQLDTNEKLNLAEQKLRYADLLMKESEFNNRIIAILERIRDKEYLLQKREIELDAKEQLHRIEVQRFEADKILLEVDKKIQEVELGKRELSVKEQETLAKYRDEEHRIKLLAFEQKQEQALLLQQAKVVEIKNLMADQRLNEVDLVSREKQVKLDAIYNRYANDLEERRLKLMGKEIELHGRELLLQVAEQRLYVTMKEKELAIKQVVMDMIQHTFVLEEKFLKQMGEKQVLQMQVQQLQAGLQLAKLASDAKEAEMRVREKVIDLNRREIDFSDERARVQHQHNMTQLQEKANAINSTITKEKEIIQKQLFEVRDREFQSHANRLLQQVESSQSELRMEKSAVQQQKYANDAERWHTLVQSLFDRDFIETRQAEIYRDEAKLYHEKGRLEHQRAELSSQESELAKEHTKMLNDLDDARARENYARIDALEERKRADMLNSLLRYG